MGMSNTPIKCIVETLSTKGDRGGNRSHIAVFYNPKVGQHQCVRAIVWGERNGEGLAFRLFNDWEPILKTHSTITEKQFDKLSQECMVESDANFTNALAGLFDLPFLPKA